MIGWLGTGLLGAGFVRAELKRGQTVHVWNRSVAKARALEADGALAFEDPADAVRGATRVHLCLSDDAAVDDVLELARAGLAPDTILVDHTTTSPAGAAARVARWKERGFPFQHAPVFMGPQNALDATGFMLASGDRALFDRLEPALSRMTGRLVYFGPQAERAAGMKLLGNLFLVALVGGLADMLTLARALDIPPAEVSSMLDWFNPGAQVPGRLGAILKGEFTRASWNLAMARKDSRLMVEASAEGGRSLTVIPAVAELMDRWIRTNHAHDDWTVIASDVVA
jgi:3-hydroxyisobutyrate dehydrogenase